MLNELKNIPKYSTHTSMIYLFAILHMHSSKLTEADNEIYTIAKAVTSLLLVLKILRKYLFPMKQIPLSSSVNQMVTFHPPPVLQSPAICAVRRHTLQTTFSLLALKVLLFFLPFPSLCLRKSKAIFFEQFKKCEHSKWILEGCLTIHLPHEIM
jgi:hypothetical protein